MSVVPDNQRNYFLFKKSLHLNWCFLSIFKQRIMSIETELSNHKKIVELFGTLSWDIQTIDTSEISKSHYRKIIRELIYKRFLELDVLRSNNNTK